jgi:hypothetical protein
MIMCPLDADAAFQEEFVSHSELIGSWNIGTLLDIDVDIGKELQRAIRLKEAAVAARTVSDQDEFFVESAY